MTENKILKLLYEKNGGYLPVSEIESSLDISSGQVELEIQNLRDKGYKIDSSQSGYRLTGVPNLLLPYEIKKNLKTKFLGRNIHFFKEVDSTNDVARELADEGAEEGSIIVAESQRSGKGRRGKKWISPSGGVWMTIILRPDVEPSKAPQLTLVTGVAVAETLDQECGLNIGIKWPNDILIGDKKVSGILTEVKTKNGKVDYVLVGIGIDLNMDVSIFPPELRGGATSLKTELDREIRGAELVQRFLQRFEYYYTEFCNGNFRDILNQWRRLSSTIGTYVEVHKKGRTVHGEAVGVNKDGKLILELDDGTLRKVISGECIHSQKK
ncbi:MAG TPA: biotin--[acetyl-CoA-carboxylase] ligase [Methanobacterium sp.]|nr:biotin--[acetyl-CoA-carboxylase] ligase [Methanobacterium sp.]